MKKKKSDLAALKALDAPARILAERKPSYLGYERTFAFQDSQGAWFEVKFKETPQGVLDAGKEAAAGMLEGLQGGGTIEDVKVHLRAAATQFSQKGFKPIGDILEGLASKAAGMVLSADDGMNVSALQEKFRVEYDKIAAELSAKLATTPQGEAVGKAR